MKRVLLGAMVLGAAFTGSASAGQSDDSSDRLRAIEKENAAIRKENAALLENKRLQEQNGMLRMSSAREPQPLAPAVAVPAAPVAAAAAAEEKGTWATVKKTFSSVFSSEQKAEKKDVFEAYAADLPVKAIAPPRPGILTFWGEGGAIWTGGDPVFADFNLINPTNLFGLLGVGNSGVPAHFQLDPKIGWEAATGFDYRFANSPWHVSGQFRYGEGGKTSGSAAVSGQLPASLIALINGAIAGGGIPAITSIGGSEAVNVSYKETHWIADGAVGYDIATSGRSSVQLKGGIRVGEMTTQMNSSDATNLFINFATPLAAPLSGNTIAINRLSTVENRANFLGAGPLIGMDGTVRFMNNWSFDYKGDMAILFGSAHNQNTTTNTLSLVPPFLAALIGGGNVSTGTADKFAYVLSADLQAGIGYWVTPNVKLAASWRIDSMINVQNTQARNNANFVPLTPTRYWQGPRVSVTAAFVAE